VDAALDLDALNRPMTDAQKRQAVKAIERVSALREALLAERAGALFPAAEDDLRDLRSDLDTESA
jgi:hypothetical protein